MAKSFEGLSSLHRGVGEGEGAICELLCLHGGELESGRENRLNGVGDLDIADIGCRPPTLVSANDPPLIDQPANDLLKEEGIPLGSSEDPVVNGGRQILDGEQEAHQSIGVLDRKGLQEYRGVVASPPSPAGASGGEVGASLTQQQDRSGQSVGELLQQVEERGVGPVDV